jgi:hypothetical protein
MLDLSFFGGEQLRLENVGKRGKRWKTVENG